jgi:hypothetical protein
MGSAKLMSFMFCRVRRDGVRASVRVGGDMKGHQEGADGEVAILFGDTCSSVRAKVVCT